MNWIKKSEVSESGFYLRKFKTSNPIVIEIWRDAYGNLRFVSGTRFELFVKDTIDPEDTDLYMKIQLP